MTMAKVTPTLKRLAVSVWYVSYTPVVLHAELNDKLRRRKINLDDMKRGKPKTETRLLKWNLNIKSSRSLDCTRKQVYYICYNGLCKPIAKYIYGSEKHSFYKSFRSKAPKTQLSELYKHPKKKQ